ncbi:MAG TPA: hypothetical protein DIT18_02570 [Pseudomonas sp.]|nr:hypothetical protein [Pseudomonas sp.]
MRIQLFFGRLWYVYFYMLPLFQWTRRLSAGFFVRKNQIDHWSLIFVMVDRFFDSSRWIAKGAEK